VTAVARFSAPPALDQILEIGRLHADEQAPSGSVRVAAMARPFELLGMEWLVEFYARYPHISLEFLLDDTPTDLISERIDLALRMGIETGSGFKVRRLAPSAMILAVSPAYLERRAAPRTLHELAEPCNSIVRMSSRGSIAMRRR